MYKTIFANILFTDIAGEGGACVHHLEPFDVQSMLNVD